MQNKGFDGFDGFDRFDADGLPHDPAGERRSAGRSTGANYAIGAALIVVAVLSFVFLSGATAVVIGVAAAVAGAVFVLMGIQGATENGPDMLAEDYSGQQRHNPLPDPAADYDWDGSFRREFDDDQHR